MKRGRIVVGWLVALVASALPVLWFMAGRVERNHLGKFIDPETGAWTAQVYSQFFTWWSPIAVPVTLLALACMVLNRPARPH
jgi:hypothetical protein